MEKYHDMFTGGPENKVAMVAISVGVLMTATSFLGILGIFKKSSSAIYAFGILVILLLIIELAVGTTVYALK